jgi:hypothetical protein
LIGRFASCWLVVCVCTAAVSVWRIIASAETSTDSCSVPTASLASTRTAVSADDDVLRTERLEAGQRHLTR